MSKQTSKVIIMGAGIGGLTTAHELAKRGLDVVVYERNEIVGGLARSAYYKHNGNSYPVEYSWRVYGSEYKNLLRLLKEIPLRQRPAKSVRHNLREVWTYVFPRIKKAPIVIDRGHRASVTFDFSKKEKLKIVGKILYCLTMSRARMDSLDSLKWKDFCSDLSVEASKYLVKLWGPVLGMDPTRMSFPVVARFAQVVLGGYFHSAASLYLATKPTNDAWFDEWTAYLEGTGKVTIRKNCEITDIKMRNKSINRIVLRDTQTGAVFTDQADSYVCAMSLEVVAALVSKNADLAADKTLKNTSRLAKRGYQIQLSVQVFLDKKLSYPTADTPILYLPDSPWALIVEPQDLVWGATYSDDPKVKSVLSIGICQTDRPGIVHHKPFIKCTEQEVRDEVWAQMVASCATAEITAGRGSLDSAKILYFAMWHSFTYDPTTKLLNTSEPKFSNNAGALRYQPSCNTDIPNLFFATGYTKTERFIYSMESAAEAGIRCANTIAAQHRAPGRAAKIYPFRPTLWFFRPFAALDGLLFRFGLPHLLSWLR